VGDRLKLPEEGKEHRVDKGKREAPAVEEGALLSSAQLLAVAVPQSLTLARFIEAKDFAGAYQVPHASSKSFFLLSQRCALRLHVSA